MHRLIQEEFKNYIEDNKRDAFVIGNDIIFKTLIVCLNNLFKKFDKYTDEAEFKNNEDYFMQSLSLYNSLIQLNFYHQNKDSNLVSLFRKIYIFEFCINGDGILLRGDRIVIPKALQQECLRRAHEGHLGIVKTKALIRSKIWYPGMDDAIEYHVRGCIACQANGPTQKLAPFQMTQMPAEPWSDLAADFYGPIANGGYLMVVIDEYSRYPVVEYIKQINASTVITALTKIFALLGHPKTLKTDNGPPFNGHEFKRRLNELNITHKPITPYWPRANGLAESFMKNLTKVIVSAVIEHKSWDVELIKFLRNYRETPHPTTGVAPASLILRNPNTSTLPNLNRFKPNELDKLARERNDASKAQTKTYADARQGTQERKLVVGDLVLHRWQKTGKSVPKYDPKPYTVTAINGTMVCANRPNHGITRNISFFKRISSAPTGQAASELELTKPKRREEMDNYRAYDKLILLSSREERREPDPEQPQQEQNPPRVLRARIQNRSQTNRPQTNPSQTNRPQTNPSQTNRPQTNPSQTNPSQTDPPQMDQPQPGQRSNRKSKGASKIPIRTVARTQSPSPPPRRSSRNKMTTERFVAGPASGRATTTTQTQIGTQKEASQQRPRQPPVKPSI